MIAAWMLYVNAVGALLAVGAALAERGCLAARRPVRHLWSAAMLATLLAGGWYLVPRAPAEAGIAAAPAAEPLPAGTGLARASAGPSPPRGLTVPDDWAAFDRPLLVLWAAASLLCGLWLAGGAALLRRKRRAWLAGVMCGQPVLVSSDVGPALVGVLRPRVVVPRWALALDAGQQELIVAHEREHARARDPLLLAGAGVLALLAPWCVAGWYLLRRLSRAIEIDCDLRIVRSGRAVRQYGDLLIDIRARGRTSSPSWPALVGFAVSVTDRLKVLTAPPPRRPARRLLLHVVPGAMIAAAACGVPRAQLSRPAIAPLSRDAAGAQRADRSAGAPWRLEVLAGDVRTPMELNSGRRPWSARNARSVIFTLDDRVLFSDVRGTFFLVTERSAAAVRGAESQPTPIAAETASEPDIAFPTALTAGVALTAREKHAAEARALLALPTAPALSSTPYNAAEEVAAPTHTPVSRPQDRGEVRDCRPAYGGRCGEWRLREEQRRLDKAKELSLPPY